jgi:hypothetical protein
VAEYRVGAERVQRDANRAARPGRLVQRFAWLPDVNARCHALDDAGEPLCTYGGRLTVVADRAWASLNPKYKCPTCVIHAGL